eukprot:TRINITY_DN35233_c0_g1_i1.p1 TRINITY_DN35233_c0_g1~~TRINITY_DN35233_c0_g1_i1.p1  ORF type:complete len:548 (-),score=48.40 TRINITY_DN35233_c0_g1_i1:95-1669(-)
MSVESAMVTETVFGQRHALNASKNDALGHPRQPRHLTDPGNVCLHPCYMVNRTGVASEEATCTPGDDCACHGARRCIGTGYCWGDLGSCDHIQWAADKSRSFADELRPRPVDGFSCCNGAVARDPSRGSSRPSARSLQACTDACENLAWCSVVDWHELDSEPCWLGVRQSEAHPNSQGSGSACVKLADEIQTATSSSVAKMCRVDLQLPLKIGDLPDYAQVVNSVGDCRPDVDMGCTSGSLTVCIPLDKFSSFSGHTSVTCVAIQARLSAEPIEQKSVEQDKTGVIVVLTIVGLAVCFVLCGALCVRIFGTTGTGRPSSDSAFQESKWDRKPTNNHDSKTRQSMLESAKRSFETLSPRATAQGFRVALASSLDSWGFRPTRVVEPTVVRVQPLTPENAESAAEARQPRVIKRGMVERVRTFGHNVAKRIQDFCEYSFSVAHQFLLGSRDSVASRQTEDAVDAGDCESPSTSREFLDSRRNVPVTPPLAWLQNDGGASAQVASLSHASVVVAGRRDRNRWPAAIQ